MKGRSFSFVWLGIMMLAGFAVHCFAGNFDTATETVGYHTNGVETPDNQLEHFN